MQNQTGAEMRSAVPQPRCIALLAKPIPESRFSEWTPVVGDQKRQIADRARVNHSLAVLVESGAQARLAYVGDFSAV